MKAIETTVLFGLFLAFTGCATVNVKYDYNLAETDFSKYHTFQFAPAQPLENENELLVERIRRAVTESLQAKGFVAAAEGPDLLITVLSSRKAKTDLRPYGYSLIFGDDAFFGLGVGGRLYQYDVGEITLEFVETNDMKLVWRGVGARALPDNENPTTIQKYVDETIRKLFEHFPPMK